MVRETYDVQSFEAWLANAKAGDVAAYARGMLPCLIEKAKAADPDEADRIMDMRRAATVAWRAYERGLVELVQKRIGFADFEYLAVRTKWMSTT